MLVDFLDVKQSMRDVIARLDHRFLNDCPALRREKSLRRNIAEYFYEELTRGVPPASNPVPVRVREVKVWETDIQSATYRP